MAAFSLVELLIVIAIIGILSSVAIPSYNEYLIKAKMVEFFVVADAYKLQLVEKIISNQKIDQHVDHVNVSNLVAKAEYINLDNKYILKLTANMNNIGIKPINNTPLIVEFIAEENQTNNLIIWSCQYNAGYSGLMSKNCREMS